MKKVTNDTLAGRADVIFRKLSALGVAEDASFEVLDQLFNVIESRVDTLAWEQKAAVGAEPPEPIRAPLRAVTPPPKESEQLKHEGDLEADDLIYKGPEEPRGVASIE